MILRSRLRANLRRWRRRRFAPLTTLVLVALATLAAAGLATAGLGLGRGLSRAADELGAQLASAGVSATDLVLAVPSLVFLVGWLTLFFLSFAALVGTLYLRRDLPGLLVAPVPMRAVFTAQFLEALALPLFWALVLALPLLWGFAFGLGLAPAAFAVGLASTALLPLVPLSLAAAATLLLLRLVPAPRATEILTIVGTLFGVGIWVFSQSLGTVAERLNGAGTVALQGAQGLAAPWLPWAWAARAMVAAGTGDALAALGYGAAFAALSLGTFAGCVVLAERVYYDGWVQAGEGPRRPRRSRPGIGPVGGEGGRLLPRAAVAIAHKDWRLMRRDPRGYSSVIWILAMLLFWTWRLRQESASSDPEVAGLMALPGLAALASLAPVAVALVLSGMRWGLESVSRDQRAFQLLQAAPVRWRHVALGKWLGAFLPSLAVALVVLGIASAAGGLLSPEVWWRNILVTVPLLAAETAIMVAFGAARPRFDWNDPKEMTAGLTGCLGGLVAWAYVGVSLALVGIGLVVIPLVGLPPAAGWAGWLAATALAVAVAWAALAFAAERLAAVEL